MGNLTCWEAVWLFIVWLSGCLAVWLFGTWVESGSEAEKAQQQRLQHVDLGGGSGVVGGGWRVCVGVELHLALPYAVGVGRWNGWGWRWLECVGGWNGFAWLLQLFINVMRVLAAINLRTSSS